MDIFDRYPFNGIKKLDYLDFKEAFLAYFNRSGLLSNDLRNKILKLKGGLNTGRMDFTMPKDHKVKITSYWLLGLIEGEGSFSITRYPLRPRFQLLFTGSQKFLLEEIKNYLINQLAFDRFSLWILHNSSIIALYEMKAKVNSKPTVSLEIRNIYVLNNYLNPFLANLKFLSKKGKDFKDFLLICQTLYKGGHKDNKIKDLIVKLSFTMNDFRLSTYNGNEKQFITQEEIFKIKTAPTMSLVLVDGRVKDLISGKIDHQNESSVYQIIKSGELTSTSSEEILVKTLKEAANVVGVHYNTLSKKLESLKEFSYLKINNYLVKRIKIFGC